MAKHAPVSFARNIRPLFRPIDVAHMLPYGVRLADHAYMADPAGDYRNARSVAAYLVGMQQPRMPLFVVGQR